MCELSQLGNCMDTGMRRELHETAYVQLELQIYAIITESGNLPKTDPSLLLENTRGFNYKACPLPSWRIRPNGQEFRPN